MTADVLARSQQQRPPVILQNFNGLDTHRKWLFFLIIVVKAPMFYIDLRPGRAVKIGNAPV